MRSGSPGARIFFLSVLFLRAGIVAADEFRSRIEDLVRKREPAKWEHTEQVLDKLVSLGINKEAKLYTSLCLKYGEEPHEYSLADDLLAGDDDVEEEEEEEEEDSEEDDAGREDDQEDDSQQIAREDLDAKKGDLKAAEVVVEADASLESHIKAKPHSEEERDVVLEEAEPTNGGVLRKGGKGAGTKKGQSEIGNAGTSALALKQHPLVPDQYLKGMKPKDEADLRRRAEKIYKVIFSDGLGRTSWTSKHELWYRHKPSSRTTFVESFVAVASGMKKPEEVMAQELKRGPLVDSVEELFVQKRHKLAILDRYDAKGARPWEPIGPDPAQGKRAHWDVPCAETLWRSRYPNCHIGPPHGDGPACRKAVVDGLVSDEEAETVIKMMEQQYSGKLDRMGYLTMMMMDEERREQMGEEVYEIMVSIFERVQEAIADALNITEVYYSGSLLNRLDTKPNLDFKQFDGTYDNYEAHSDQANHGSYDFGALLYLTTKDADFGGGELAFNDPDMDRRITPIRGRAVFYTGGLESLHSIRPLTWGKRYMLSIWYTCNSNHAVKGLGRYAREKLPATRGSSSRLLRS
mmetsp:Transcript_28238/g.62465  ORF Transcript_28238/g.62465 Transcript_28238/m.62465 type:complete len:577 (-) Transcript_28238:12-1742(-)